MVCAAVMAGGTCCVASALHDGCCRGVVHFDYVSGQGISKNAPILDNSDLNALLWRKCNLSVEGEREQSLSPEKQVMRLRMLAPLLAVNSTQVSMCSVADVILIFEFFFWLVSGRVFTFSR